jgi:hypothetical protein
MTRYCPDCRNCTGTPARRVCALGMLSAPGEATTCAAFAPSDPLTPAERARLDAYEAWGPMRLMDVWQANDYAALRQKAAGK